MTAGIKMWLADGGFRALEAPGSEHSPAVAEAVFEAGCRAISGEFAVRHASEVKEKGRRKDAKKRGEANHVAASTANGAQGSAIAWLHKTGYPYLSLTLESGHTGLFENRIRGFERDRGERGRDVNPFQRGLLALFAHDKGGLRERDREWIGKRLWYAFRHYVPSEFVTGFLHEVWHADPWRPAIDALEPGLEEWICIQRAHDETPELRGRYPEELEDRVRAAALLIEIAFDTDKRAGRTRLLDTLWHQSDSEPEELD